MSDIENIVHDDHLSGPLRRQGQGYTLWFTGLSASGKSSICTATGRALIARLERQIYVIDGDLMRKTINRDLGYVQEERNLASERIAHIAKILNDNGIICLVSNISQDNQIRKLVREIISDFFLIHVHATVDECARRDYKRNYEKAFNGKLENFVGVDIPYEHPEDADLTIDTHELTVSEAAEKIIGFLSERGKLEK
jgi:adenylylsulfate kinase